MHYTEITTIADICKATGEDPNNFLPFPTPKTTIQEGDNAFHLAQMMVNAINGDWEADYDNTNQIKWEAVWKWNAETSRFGFWFSRYTFTHSVTFCGSRLVFESEEKLIYSFKTFPDIWNDYLIKNKKKK